MSILVLKHSDDNEERKVVAKCDCAWPEHYASFHWIETDSVSTDWSEMYIHIGMAKQTFWRRIWFAIKYVFGYQSRFGAYEETALSAGDVKVLAEYLTDASKTLAKQNQAFADSLLK